MKHGIFLPPFAELADPLTELGAPRSLDLAVRASLHRLAATEVAAYVRSAPPR